MNLTANKLKQLILLFILSTLLSACDNSYLTKIIYYNWEEFTFENKKESSNYTYLCKPGLTKKETKERAEIAHQFLLPLIEKNIKLSNTLLEEMETDDFSYSDVYSVTQTIRKNAIEYDRLGKEKYNCFLTSFN